MAWAVAGCGGGGGDAGETMPSPTPTLQSPPSSAAAIDSTGTDAARAAQSATVEAAAVATRRESLAGLEALLGAQVPALQSAAGAPQQHALAVTTEGCAEYVDAPCTGSARVDTNIADDAVVVPAGGYYDVTFSGVQGGLEGATLLLNGRLRIGFVDSFNLLSRSLSGLHLNLLLEAFGGSLNGHAFGPLTEATDLRFGSGNAIAFTAGGRTLTNLSGIHVTDADTWSIGSATVRVSHWSNPNGYVDITFADWGMDGGRPTVGGSATVSALPGTSITISVTASSQGEVRYRVRFAGPLGSVSFDVVATYPAGGGTPVYVPLPG